MNPKIPFDRQKVLFVLAVAVSLAIGVSGGVLLEKRLEIARRDPIAVVPQNSEKIPLVKFQKIENGVMYGETGEKEVRFIVGKEGVYTSHGGAFDFPLNEILPMMKQIAAPEGMNFVASKRGTRYWPLDAPEAFLLAEKNRVFFATAEEAEKAGYKKGE